MASIATYLYAFEMKSTILNVPSLLHFFFVFSDIPARPGRPIVKVQDAYSLDVEWAHSTESNNSTITHYILVVR